jgi:hypothetical protein
LNRSFELLTSGIMNINRHNYEEFFILYMDKELSSDDRRQVELFVAENPDLKTELDLLLQSQLIPDTAEVFSHKEQLLRSASGVVVIDHANYEEWLLSYVDGELSADQKIIAEKFVSGHPEIKAELDSLQKTKLQPDTAVVFLNKEGLYRREEKVRVIGINWKRIAVAATLLVAVSSTAFFLFNNVNDKGNNQAEITLEPNKKEPTQSNSAEAIQQPVDDIASTNDNASNKTNDVIIEDNADNNNTSDIVEPKKKNEELKQKTIPELLPVIKNDEPVLADNSEKENNNLPQPAYDPYVTKVAEDNLIAMVEPGPVKEPLTNLNETNSIPTVTPNNPQPLDDMIAVASREPAKKNKLRGFFRKVTRTFEKNTNIKATDDEDRLLLGGLAIKL